MTQPLVSVKMITYNHAPFVAQAIEKVLQQETAFPFELVIGEDCSTDGTREVVFDYQKKYPGIIKVVTSDKNVGMKKNGNRTMKACRGKYIAYCEGDDYWHRPDKLQMQVDYMESHPECGMVFADCDVYHTNSGELQRSVRYSDGYRSPLRLGIEEILGDVKLRNWPWTCTAMCRRDLVQKVVQGDPYLHQSDTFPLGDVQLFAELALRSEVVYIPECLATYRVLDESASNTKDAVKHLRFWKSLCEMEMYLYYKHRLSDNIYKRAVSIWCDKSLCLAFHERNPELAKEVMERKRRLTWKEWIRYYGAKNTAVYYVGFMFIALRNKMQSVGIKMPSILSP